MRTPNAQTFARLIDGEFPRYSAVLPTETEHRMEADRDALAQKLRLVANVTGDDARARRALQGRQGAARPERSGARVAAARPRSSTSSTRVKGPRSPSTPTTSWMASSSASPRWSPSSSSSDRAGQVHARRELRLRRDAHHHRRLNRRPRCPTAASLHASGTRSRWGRLRVFLSESGLGASSATGTCTRPGARRSAPSFASAPERPLPPR